MDEFPFFSRHLVPQNVGNIMFVHFCLSCVGGRNKPIGELVKTPPQIPLADKFKKPYIKVVRDSCLWDSGRWEGWEIILELIPPPFFRDIWSHKTSETLFLFVIFSIFLEMQISALLRKLNSGTTTPGTASKS